MRATATFKIVGGRSITQEFDTGTEAENHVHRVLKYGLWYKKKRYSGKTTVIPFHMIKEVEIKDDLFEDL